MSNFGIILFLDGSEGWDVENSILEEIETVSVTKTIHRWINLIILLEVSEPGKYEVSVTAFPFVLSESKAR